MAHAPSPVSQTEKTIIGRQVTIEGEIQGSEDLVIEGEVKGSIELENFHLIVGPEGKVEAKIHAGNVTVSGHVKGNIKALDKVEIIGDADFIGEIKAKRISMEDGVYIKAVIEVEREPQKKVEAVGKEFEFHSPGTGKKSTVMANEAEKED